MLENDSSSDNK